MAAMYLKSRFDFILNGYPGVFGLKDYQFNNKFGLSI